VQVGLGPPALISTVPVGGFELNVKQVLLQPTIQTANSSAAQNVECAQYLLGRFTLKQHCLQRS
jgi:hypothetical protein